jgi:hypothetical protein
MFHLTDKAIIRSRLLRLTVNKWKNRFWLKGWLNYQKSIIKKVTKSGIEKNDGKDLIATR